MYSHASHAVTQISGTIHLRHATLLTFGDRSFAVAGPRAWNDLPVTLRNTDLTTNTFCKHLKTVLFTDS